MKNTISKKLSSLLLALGMIIPGYAGTVVSAAATQPIDVLWNIECAPQKDLTVVYNVKINESGSFTEPKLRVSIEKFSGAGAAYTWDTVTLTDYTYDASTKQYRFVYDKVTAVQIGSRIKSEFICRSGNQAYESDPQYYSLKEYAMDVINAKDNSTKEADLKQCALMVDMLNYGAAAQTFFGRNTNNLANAKLTSDQKKLGTKLVTSAATCLKTNVLTSATAWIEKVALEFDNPVDFIAYASFKTAPSGNISAQMSYAGDDGKTVTVKVDSKNFEKQEDTGLYRIEFKNIPITCLKTQAKIVIKNGSDNISSLVTYSCESYANAILAGSEFRSSLKDLVKRMLTYGGGAKAYAPYAGSVSEDPGDDGDISTYKNSKYTKDMPKAVIVIPASASEYEKYAAKGLQTYIARVENYTPEIINDSVTKGSKGFEISLGNTRNRAHGTMKYSSDGAYKIYSYDSGISITGKGKRGVIDGSAKFLSLCGGYYWLSFEDGYKTNQKKFKYEKDINYDYQRPFVFSDIDAAYGTVADGENCMFDIAHGLNGYFANFGTAYQRWYLYDPESVSLYPESIHPGQVHTLLYEYLTEADFKVHPEWFSLIGGVRQRTQPCLSNAKARQHILEHVYKILNSKVYDASAPMQIISLCQADNSEWCKCSSCTDFMKKYKSDEIDKDWAFWGGDSPLYIDLCNWVSEQIHKDGKYQNVYIDTLAYDHTLKPPKGLKINDHVIVRYAAINRCYAHDCNDQVCQRNKEDGAYLKQWADLCKAGGGQLWIWDYNANWYSTITPYANVSALIHDIKYYKQIGVKGIYLQSNDRHLDCNTEFDDIRLYMGATLLEDPNADWEKELEFFLNEFYGKGAPYIREYLELMTKQAKNHLCGSNCPDPYHWRLFCLRYDTKPREIFCNEYLDYDGTNYTSAMDAHNRMPDADINKCEQIYNEAIKAVANDSKRHKYTTARTLVSWKIVKSTLKVKEFANSSTYATRNGELYDELVDTYNTKIFSLIFRTRTRNNLSKNPGEWVVKQ